jgi:hypothetical protein
MEYDAKVHHWEIKFSREEALKYFNDNKEILKNETEYRKLKTLLE